MMRSRVLWYGRTSGRRCSGSDFRADSTGLRRGLLRYRALRALLILARRAPRAYGAAPAGEVQRVLSRMSNTNPEVIMRQWLQELIAGHDLTTVRGKVIWALAELVDEPASAKQIATAIDESHVLVCTALVDLLMDCRVSMLVGSESLTWKRRG